MSSNDDRLSKYVKGNVDGYKYEICVIDFTKPRSCYFYVGFWANPGFEDMHVLMHQLTKDIKYYGKSFKDVLNYSNSLCTVEYAEDSTVNNLKNKNTYFCVEFTFFFDRDIDIKPNKDNSINVELLTCLNNLVSFVKDFDGLHFSPVKK